MDVGLFFIHETLRETGFYKGFGHGAATESLNQLLDSEIMQRILDSVLERVNRRIPREQQINRILVSNTIKLILQISIMRQRQANNSPGTGFMGDGRRFMDELFMNPINGIARQQVVNQIALQLSIRDDVCRQVIDSFFMFGHDYYVLKKPLYNFGYKTGVGSVHFSRSVAEDTFNYDLEEEPCCARFMNIITFGLWANIFGQDNRQARPDLNRIENSQLIRPALGERPHID